MRFNFYKENGYWNLEIKETNSNVVLDIYHFGKNVDQEDIIKVITILTRADNLYASVDFTNHINKNNE